MELKTIDGWHKSGCGDWDTYCKPGELVDEGVADYFLDILPPRTMKKGYFQVGEPHSHAVNPETMQSCGTYATFVRVGGGMWEYKGHCFPNGLTEAERYVKYDGLKDFFQKTYKLMAGIVQIPRPHIFCKDGFKMSVQAGDSLYCTPRTNLESGEYETCEVGFPNQREELLMPYAEDPETTTETVYGYVPVTLVEQIIEKHGGWFESKIPFA